MDRRDARAETFEELSARLAQRIIELGNTQDDQERAAGIREVFAPDYVLHARTGTVTGVDGYIERITANLRTFPGIRFSIDDLVAQGDRFAMRYHWTAPHGDGQVGNEALEINRVADGQVIETWNFQDMLSLMADLGVVESPFAPRS
jgi:predicted ester cyclase